MLFRNVNRQTIQPTGSCQGDVSVMTRTGYSTCLYVGCPSNTHRERVRQSEYNRANDTGGKCFSLTLCEESFPQLMPDRAAGLDYGWQDSQDVR